MDSHNKAILDFLPLERLVARALRYLERIGYSRRSLRRYDHIWGHLVSFAEEKGFGDEFSEDLEAGFVEDCRSHDDARRGWRLHAAFGVRMLGDFRRDGCIERSRTDKMQAQHPGGNEEAAAGLRRLLHRSTSPSVRRRLTRADRRSSPSSWTSLGSRGRADALRSCRPPT